MGITVFQKIVFDKLKKKLVFYQERKCAKTVPIAISSISKWFYLPKNENFPLFFLENIAVEQDWDPSNAK